ncbi:MAG: molecular chaperone HtpG [Burkholderiaceae bacterium]
MSSETESVNTNGANRETIGFQTEVKQLLQLMIHSLYSNPEIFLRELVSNASDACDKLRFEAIDNDALYEGDGELRIRVTADADARTITISDNGIGMNRDEVVANLGTIARSGTKEFVGQLSGDAANDSQMIGQFGVGFYSSFIVADQVVVLTRRAGESASQGVRWESDGSGEFSIEPADRATRGTEITLHLRTPEGEGADEAKADLDRLLQDWQLQSIIRKYSDHISLPIQMPKRPEPASGDDEDSKKEEQLIVEWETINQASALWSRSKSELKEEDYQAFYKNMSHDGQDALAYTHNRVEGRTEYTQLLFVPSKAPHDIWDRENRRGLKLYVKRVFILDDAKNLMPVYLRFVRGVIDSSDLPLNVSREILQESRDVKAIRDGSTRRVLTMLEDLAENQVEKYQLFWKEFGQVLKEGMGEDFSNQERLAKLLRFQTTESISGTEDATVSFEDYVGRMKEGQEKIYYVTAETLAGARNSPHLEVFRKKGVEVLLMSERVDEWMLNFLTSFDGKDLVSVARGDVDLGGLDDEKEKESREKVAEEFKDLVAGVKSALNDKVKDVRVTHRLTESASCLVSDDGDMSANLERLLKQAGQDAPARKPILEINPEHPILKHLASNNEKLDEWSALLFEQAVLSEGGQLDNPADFVRKQNNMMLALLERK